MGKWFGALVCKECDGYLSTSDCIHNRCCPHCGYNGGPLNFWKDKVVRRIAPWWKFWDNRIEIKK